MPEDCLLKTELPWPKRAGKVRDVYELRLADGRDAVLLVATDRISAFDVVLANGIPDRGRTLARISHWWFERIAAAFGGALDHHVLGTDPALLPGLAGEERERLAGRITIGRRTEPVPVECVVRGYLAGSGWKEYREHGTVCGVALPPGLRESDPLPEPIFTPATKAEAGHDQNITFAESQEIAGRELMERLRAHSIAVYRMAHEVAAERGILIADTKLEFGLDPETREPVLIDEALTPDSSRFWPAEQYEPGAPQPSFDKQFVRDYLQELVDAGEWDKNAPAPELPPEIVERTRAKYRDALERLTGATLT